MNVVTGTELLKWLTDNKGNRGIQVEGARLHYVDPNANCIELEYPSTPLRIAYFSRVASMMGTKDESMFYGAFLWITLSTIGSNQVEKSGWKMVEKMRQGYGENRPLQTANGHHFRSDEIADLAAFLVPCFVYGWDAFVVPNGMNDFFIHISHDEYWGVVARTKERYDALFTQLKDLHPKESAAMRGTFCR
jgi:hypothetical protein